MEIRRNPEFRNNSDKMVYLDSRRNDYTKMTNRIQYCSLDTDNIPAKPGIYFFYMDDKLLYVGQSINIKKRIRDHISINKHITNALHPLEIDIYLHHANRIEFELYPEGELTWIESFYQTRLKPKCIFLRSKNPRNNDLELVMEWEIENRL